MSQKTEQYEKLLSIVTTLRAPDGCPWDREQTHASLTECLIEECAELLEAIDKEDFDHMLEELGDVLLNVVMQTEIAREAGRFDMEDVSREIHDKLVRRHPHVFDRDRVKAENSGEVLKKWDEIKAGEKQSKGVQEDSSPFKPLPPRFPSLLFAKKTYKHLQKASLTQSNLVPSKKIDTMVSEYSEEELAEMLFSIASACRVRDLDPERLTRDYTQRLIDQLS